MSGKIVILYPNGRTEEETYDGDDPKLETLQGHVGGYIEQIPVLVNHEGQKCVAYANEDGLQHEMPPNNYASRLCEPHYIVGNLVIVVETPGTRKETENASREGWE